MKKYTSQSLPVTRIAAGLLCCFVIGAVLFFPDPVFAQETSTAQDINGWMMNTIKLLSWFWVVPASVAGKLMTNSMAFGSPFFLDTYLFKMWQFMRTLALFTLGFVFIANILLVFVKQEQVSKLGQLVFKTAVAGLLIPMSWFLIAALVDFSIIGTSAVASLPLQVLEEQWKEINQGEAKFTCYKKVKVDSKGTVDSIDMNEAANIKELTFEDVMPSGDSVAGPLFFMGCGILNMFDFTNLTDSEVDYSDVFELNLIKLLIGVMLFIPMIALMVVNVMRIFFIWVWAMFGPFIVLDLVFKGPLTKADGAYKKYFSLKNIIGLIFQPVLVVGLVGVSMILILGVYSGMSGRRDDIKDRGGLNDMCFTPIGTNSGRIDCGGNGEFIMDGALFQKSAKALVGGALGELILIGFTIIILWGLFTVGFKASDITASTADGIFKAGKNIAGAIPIIPTGNGKSVGVGAAIKAKDSLKRQRGNKFKGQQAADAERLLGMIGLGATGTQLRPSEIAELEAVSEYVSTSSSAFWDKLDELRKKRDIPWNVLKPNVEKWLSTGGYNHMVIQDETSRFLPSQQPDNISDIWSINNGLFTRAFNEYMNKGKFGSGVLNKPKTLYKATGQNTNGG